MSLSDLANDLRIHVNALGNAVIDSFRRDQAATKQLLEKYPADVLCEVKKLVQTEYHAIYEIIMKRRMAYVERERAKYRKRVEQGIQFPANESRWIDFRGGDPDDTQNLTCGLGVISKYIDIIDTVIASKNRSNQPVEKFNLHQMTCIILCMIPLVMLYLFVKS
jgi:hypothetical protein